MCSVASFASVKRKLSKSLELSCWGQGPTVVAAAQVSHTEECRKNRGLTVADLEQLLLRGDDCLDAINVGQLRLAAQARARAKRPISCHRGALSRVGRRSRLGPYQLRAHLVEARLERLLDPLALLRHLGRDRFHRLRSEPGKCADQRL